MASQSSHPLKGGTTLEGVDYINLWEESGTGEDKWLLRVTKTKWQHRLTDWVTLVVKGLQNVSMGGQLKVRM